MDYIIKHFNDIIAIMGAVIILARLIVKITPSETDNIWLEKIINSLKHLGLHINNSNNNSVNSTDVKK